MALLGVLMRAKPRASSAGTTVRPFLTHAWLRLREMENCPREIEAEVAEFVYHAWRLGAAERPVPLDMIYDRLGTAVPAAERGLAFRLSARGVLLAMMVELETSVPN